MFQGRGRRCAGAITVIAQRVDVNAIWPAVPVCGREYPVLRMISSASITLTTRGCRGSDAVSRMWIRDDRMPGTTRKRRCICGCGEFGHKHELHAFHRSDAARRRRRACRHARSERRIPAMRDRRPAQQGRRWRGSGLRSATCASVSAGACMAIVGEGRNSGREAVWALPSLSSRFRSARSRD